MITVAIYFLLVGVNHSSTWVLGVPVLGVLVFGSANAGLAVPGFSDGFAAPGLAGNPPRGQPMQRPSGLAPPDLRPEAT